MTPAQHQHLSANVFQVDAEGKLTWGAQILMDAHERGDYPECEVCKRLKAQLELKLEAV